LNGKSDPKGRPKAVLFDVGPKDPPKAVLFDVGNVIVRWRPRTLYSKLIVDPAALDHFLGEVCTMDWHSQTDAGRTFGEIIAERSALYPEHAPLIQAWWARWPEMFSGTIPETEAAIEALHARGTPIHGLTNMSVESWPGVQAMSPVFRHFHTVVVSGEEKVIKPDPAIFHLVVERTGLEPHEMLFVDDMPANIATAASLGFHVHHFTDPSALGPQLRTLGLL
jgi:2-haloacid dehalogenase/putative hydrolase of the HAD superfamily